MILSCVYAFLYLPLICVVFYSFSHSRVSGLWTHFSLQWYSELYHNPYIWQAMLTSVQIAAVSATLATVLGTCAALSLSQAKREKLLLLVTAPLIMPEMMLGLALLLFFITNPFYQSRGMLTIILGHTTLSTAYVAIIMGARLKQRDVLLEEAAADLGASPWVVLSKITLPLLRPVMIAAWLLAFVLSLDDVIIASFLSGPGATTLPVLLFSSIRHGITPEINALATLIMLGTTIVIVLCAQFFKQKRIPSYDL